MTLINRVARLEGMTGPGLLEVVRIDPDEWEAMSPEELNAFRAHVRRVSESPRGFLICVRRVGVNPSGIPDCLQDSPDPLAALLGPDDPAVIRHRGRGVQIARSYGTAG